MALKKEFNKLNIKNRHFAGILIKLLVDKIRGKNKCSATKKQRFKNTFRGIHKPKS